MNDIYLNNKFYAKEAIEQALEDFSDICKGEIINEDFQVRLYTDKEVPSLEDEFLNYVLGLMKNEGLEEQKATEEFLEEEPPKKDSKTNKAKKGFTKNFFRKKKIGDYYLITTETGDWIILSKKEFNLFKQDNEEKDEKLLKKLLEKNILIDKNNLKQCINKYANRKSFLKRGASLHIVVLSLRCDIRCKYCQTSSKPNSSKGYDMTKDTAKKVVDKIFESPSKDITIEFQGGEPLLNFETLKFMVETAKKKNENKNKNLRFSLVTNLVNMTDEKLKFLTDNKIPICTSLDGPEDVHNKTRQSHHKVTKWIKKIQKMHKEGKTGNPPHALLTVARAQLEKPNEIVDEYINQGLRGVHLRGISKLGVAKKNESEIYYSAEEFIEFWKKAMDYILDINKKGKSFIERKTLIILKKIFSDIDPNYLDLRSPCGAVIGQLLYNYDGRIYSCDEGRMLGEDDIFNIGTVDDFYKDYTTSPISCAIIASSINDTQYCDKCVFKPYCGLCPVMNYSESGSLICNVPSSDWCKIHYAQFEYIFNKLIDPETKDILESWAKENK